MTTDKTHKDENLNVLSLEDSARDFDLIKEQLIDAGYTLSMERVETEDAFTASLRDKAWDLILADFKLPGFDAFGSLRIRNEICPDTPFICVSGSIGEETAIELLKSGAVDYVIKDRPERLPFAVGRALYESREKKIRRQNDEDLKEAYRQLKESQTATLSILEDLKAENQVRQVKEAELRKVTMAVEQAGEVVLITDIDGTIQYVNPAFTDVSGYSREEVVGQNPRLLKSGKQDREFYQGLWGTITEGRIWKGRLVNKHKDGTLYTEYATISPVKDAAGRLLHYVAVKRDITEFLRAEEERAKLQEQFQQAQKMESIGRLTGGIAHDFNNLLTTVIGNADFMLADMAKDDPLREEAEDIKEAGDRGASMIRQLLAFSRKQMLQPAVTNLNDTVRGMGKMLRRLIGEDIVLETFLAPDLGWVEADEGQIEQVIMNLAVNARDSMPRGGNLTIETANAELDEEYASAHVAVIAGSYVMLAVSDSGFGMTKDVQEKIFEPFFTTKEKGQGTGLGLSTVYGIVKQSKGNIWVYSEPGEGTTFKIYLPRIDKPETNGRDKTRPSDERGRSLEGHAASWLETAGSETVLVVEDDEKVCKFSVRVLKGYGYRVLEASNGVEAIGVAERHRGPIHLLVTDVVMPGMNFTDMVNRVKSSRPEIKTLYMSGYTDNTIGYHGVLDPGVAFLAKPFSAESLGRKVKEVLEGTWRKR